MTRPNAVFIHIGGQVDLVDDVPPIEPGVWEYAPDTGVAAGYWTLIYDGSETHGVRIFKEA